jgi:phosphoketolase
LRCWTPPGARRAPWARPRSISATTSCWNGSIEEGTTTTPFLLLARNGVDRFHVLIQAVRAASPINRAFASEAEAIVARSARKLADARSYAEAHGVDPPEITKMGRKAPGC